LYAVSICQIITAVGLSVARRARLLLVLGGVAAERVDTAIANSWPLGVF
jgi:hypothetical protein